MNYSDLVSIEDVPEPISYSKLVEQKEAENFRNMVDPERKINKILKRNKKFEKAPADKDRNKVSWQKFKLKYRLAKEQQEKNVIREEAN